MRTIQLLAVLLLIGVILGWKTNRPNCKNSVYILDQVKEKYDSQQVWGTSELKIHIQEPRVSNPQRYTKLNLKNSNDYFEMERFREDGIVKRILTGNGESRIFLNGESELSKTIVEQYRLNVERTKGHKKFYQLMYGLPMSLSNDLWEQIEPARKVTYAGREAYAVALELKDEMISKHWTLLIDVENYNLLTIEFNHPEDPDKEEEVLTFEGEFEINGMKIPRIRNWYIKGTHEYLGTDVIVEQWN